MTFIFMSRCYFESYLFCIRFHGGCKHLTHPTFKELSYPTNTKKGEEA